MTDPRPEISPGGGQDSREARLAELFTHYVDRLCAGEKLSREEIRRAHPDLAAELITELETLRGLGLEDEAGRGGQPMGGQIGGYRLIGQIGRGGMGVVYKAWDQAMGRKVALKVLPPESVGDAKALARFVKEARIAGKLNHPAIVSVYGMGIENGTPWFAMEFVEGKTLAQILKDHRPSGEKDGESGWIQSLKSLSGLFRLDEAEREEPVRSEAVRSEEGTLAEENGAAPQREDEPPSSQAAADSASREINLTYCLRMARAFEGVAAGLRYAHQKGVIHRDLKPSNLILAVSSGQSPRSEDSARRLASKEWDGRLRILDFGLARLEGQESFTLTGDLVGTLLYMSPEQAMARRIEVDHRTDLYSLGATLYEMLAWRPPFKGKTHHDTLSQILFREPAPLRRINPRIPRDLETIVLKCLHKDPKDRYATAEALEQDLRRFGRGDPIEARPLPALEKIARRAWRKKGLIAALLILGLLLLTSGLLYKKHRDEQYARDDALYRRQVLDAVMLLQYGQVKPPRSNTTVLRSDPERQPPSRADVASLGMAPDPEEALRPDPTVEALALLEGAARLFPRRPEAAFQRARALHQSGREAEALQAIETLLARPEPFLPAQFWKAARLEQGAGAPSGSPHTLAAAGEKSPDWRSPYRLAQRAVAERRWAEAKGAFTALIDSLERGAGQSGPSMPSEPSEPFLGALLEARLGRGAAALELERFDEAIEDFAAVAALEPGALEPALLLAKTYLRRKLPEGAARHLEKLYASASFKNEAAQRIAALFYDIGEFEAALRWAEKIEEASAREARRGLCLERLNRKKEALEAAEKAAALGPDDLRAWHALGSVCLRQRRLASSIAAFQKAVELDGKNAALWNSLGLALDRDRQEDEAGKAYRKALELDPRSPGAHRGIGWGLLNQGKFREAEPWLRKAIDLDPKDASSLNLLGVFYSRQGKVDEAIEQYRKAIDLDSKTGAVWSNLSWDLYRKKDLEGSIRHSKKALELDADLEEPHKFLGSCYLELKRFGEAEVEYRDYLRRDPRHPVGYYNMGLLCERTGRFEEAEKWYRESLARRPGYIRALFNLANLLFFRLKRPEEALGFYQKILEIAPDHDYTLCNMGDLLIELGRLDEAAKAIERARDLDPKSPDAWWSLGTVRERQGKLAEAIDFMKKGLDCDPKSPKARADLARLLMVAGKPEEARPQLEQAIQLLEELEKTPEPDITGLAPRSQIRAAVREAASLLPPGDPLRGEN